MLRYPFAAILLLTGIVFVIVPIHMLMTGVVLLMLGAAVLVCMLLRTSQNPKLQFLHDLISLAASISLILLMTCMGLITAGENGDSSTASESEYAIVLGASVDKDSTPSRILAARIDAAIDFMNTNPNAIVILSGAQGDDEPITEASCMYQTMVAKGADPARLLTEDQSHTTLQNLKNCQTLIESRGGTNQPITLITSEFHIRRALLLADELQLNVCGWPADTVDWFFRVNYTLREVFAMVKAMLQTAIIT